MAKKAYIGASNFTPRPELPSSYSQVEYLESSGDKFLNLNCTADEYTRVKIDFMMEFGAGGIFGAFSDGGHGCNCEINVAGGELFVSYLNDEYSQEMVYGSKLSIDFDLNGVTINGNKVHDGFMLSSGTESLSLYLFAVNENDNPWCSGCRIYSCKIYNGDTLIRDLVPCKNTSGSTGMYDIANATFYQASLTSGPTASAPVAHKIKNAYIGIPTDIPIYDEGITNITITSNDMLAEYFTVSPISGTRFVHVSNGRFESNIENMDGYTAKSTWTAKQNIQTISFNYGVSSEANYDKFTLTVGNTTVANAISGAQTGTWSGSMQAGDKIVLTYSKDSSSASGSDIGYIENISISVPAQVQVGTETKDVARKIKKIYKGNANNIAELLWGGTGSANPQIFTEITTTEEDDLWRVATNGQVTLTVYCNDDEETYVYPMALIYNLSTQQITYTPITTTTYNYDHYSFYQYCYGDTFFCVVYYLPHESAEMFYSKDNCATWTRFFNGTLLGSEKLVFDEDYLYYVKSGTTNGTVNGKFYLVKMDLSTMTQISSTLIATPNATSYNGGYILRAINNLIIKDKMIYVSY
jgi:hypothetical protein